MRETGGERDKEKRDIELETGRESDTKVMTERDREKEIEREKRTER